MSNLNLNVLLHFEICIFGYFCASTAFLDLISLLNLELIFDFYILCQMFADLRCSPSCARAGIHGTVAICPPDCFQYKGTLDVFYKIIRQVG